MKLGTKEITSFFAVPRRSDQPEGMPTGARISAAAATAVAVAQEVRGGLRSEAVRVKVRAKFGHRRDD